MSIRVKLDVRRGNFSLRVDLDIPARGITSIHGPSGSGKTTILRGIAGLDRHAGCLVEVAGTTWQDDSTFLPVHQRSLGYVFQESSLFTHLDVRRNIEFGVKRAGGGQGAAETTGIIELLGLAPLLDRLPSSLSGGERRRVAIARALAPRPSLLLLDEPTAGLDARHRGELLPYLEELHAALEIPVLHVSHSNSEVLRLADHLVLLESGKVMASGALMDIQVRLDLPLAHDQVAAATIETSVQSIDHRYGLATLAFPGGGLTVVNDDFVVGQKLRIGVAARDVSISLTKHHDSSILNIFKAKIDAISEKDGTLVLLRLKVNGTPLLARVTRRSADALNLVVGMDVFAQVKSVALLR